MEDKLLSECELLVLDVIWKSDELMTIQEIAEKVNHIHHKDWQVRTVSVFLHRITKKGYLTLERKGRTYYYHPVMTEEEYQQQEIVKCVNTWSSGRADLFLCALMRERPLTETEKERIRGMIDAMG